MPATAPPRRVARPFHSRPCDRPPCQQHGRRVACGGQDNVPCVECGPNAACRLPQQQHSHHLQDPDDGRRHLGTDRNAERARCAGDRYCVGAQDESHPDHLAGPKRLRVGPGRRHLEAHARHTADHGGGDERAVVGGRAEVRRGQRREARPHLLLRGGEQLLGEQDAQGAPLDHPVDRVASEHARGRHRVHRLQVPRVLGLPEERRRQGREHALGRQPQIWDSLLRGREPRLGPRRRLLSGRRHVCLLLAQLDRQLRRRCGAARASPHTHSHAFAQAQTHTRASTHDPASLARPSGLGQACQIWVWGQSARQASLARPSTSRTTTTAPLAAPSRRWHARPGPCTLTLCYPRRSPRAQSSAAARRRSCA